MSPLESTNAPARYVLSRVPVPFALPVLGRVSGRFEFVEHHGAMSSVHYLVGGFMVCLGVFVTFGVLLTGNLRRGDAQFALAASVVLILFGAGMVYFGFRSAHTYRVLRYDGATARLRLATYRDENEIYVIDLPIQQCSLLVHPVEHRSRYESWGGFAAVVHLEPSRRGFFALCALPTEPLVGDYIAKLPEPLRATRAGTGPVFRGAVAHSRSWLRRIPARFRCPNCRQDLAAPLRPGDHCPACGQPGRDSVQG